MVHMQWSESVGRGVRKLTLPSLHKKPEFLFSYFIMYDQAHFSTLIVSLWVPWQRIILCKNKSQIKTYPMSLTSKGWRVILQKPWVLQSFRQISEVSQLHYFQQLCAPCKAVSESQFFERPITSQSQFICLFYNQHLTEHLRV